MVIARASAGLSATQVRARARVRDNGRVRRSASDDTGRRSSKSAAKGTKPDRRGPGRPRAAPIGQQRQLILDSARRVFAEHDYHGTSIDRVAKEAGVARQLVYSLYGGKNELFIAVVDDACEQMIHQMTTGVVLGPGATPRRLIAGRIKALFDFIDQHPDVAAIIRIAEYGGFGPAKSEVTAGRRRIEEGIAALFSEAWRTDARITPEASRLLGLAALSVVEAVGFRRPSEPAWETTSTIAMLTELLYGGVLRLDERRSEIESFGSAGPGKPPI